MDKIKNIECRSYQFCRVLVWLLSIVSIVTFTACANPGSGPDGGPYDETPPRLLSTSPRMGAISTKQKKVTLFFDEIVKMDNASEKLTISPPQINAPDIKSVGRHITVQLNDSLRNNTTYTLDFSDAIVDNNEGNPLGNFTFFFSTGASVDTMEVSGHVIAAENLEPVKGILVGLQGNLADSAFRTMPLERVARTDGDGHFVIKGVAPGSYRIYALKDADGNYMFTQKSELLAFQNEVIVPKGVLATRPDTIWHDSIHYDSIRTVEYTHFTPDDIVLKAFLETGQPRHLIKFLRPTTNSLTAFFTAPSNERPILKGLNFDDKDAFVTECSKNNDTLTYWIKNIELLKQDTLSLSYTYQETDDSTGCFVLRTDTLDLIPKVTYARQQEKLKQQWEAWNKQREKALKKGHEFTKEPPRVWLNTNYRVASSMAPDENVTFEFSEPLASIDTTKIHLLLGPDTAAVERDFDLIKTPYKELQYTLMGEWRPKQNYRLKVDSAAFVGITGLKNQSLDLQFRIANPDEFGSIFFNIHGVDSAMVQLFIDEKKIYRQTEMKNGRADFFYVKPGNYYVRLFIDSNGNKRWDTGDFDLNIQPEAVYYYPGELKLRAGWDINQDWNVLNTPILMQKPKVLIKQKADAKKTIKNRNATRKQNNK